MSTPQLDTRTYGEKLVEARLKGLPTTDYFSRAEPRLQSGGSSRNPDFIIVAKNYGVLVVEVKDYHTILDGSNQDTFKIKRRDGTIFTTENPENTAKNYSYMLADMLKQRSELMHFHRNRNKLKFPHQPLVIFPNLDRKIVKKLQDQNIMTSGTVLCKDDLRNVAVFQKAIENLNWLFKPKNTLDLPTRDIIRGVIHPHLVVSDNDGNDVGTLSLLQEFLSTESIDTDGNISVRLVRGVAGSGKSLILLRRARYLYENHSNLNIGILTFNTDLAEDLRLRLDNPEIDVLNFHKLCSNIFRQVKRKWPQFINRKSWIKRTYQKLLDSHNITVDFAEEEIKWRKDILLEDNQEYLNIARTGRQTALNKEKREVINEIYEAYHLHQQKLFEANNNWEDWEDVPSLALEILEQNHPLTDYYDVILVDEAQDFAPAWLKVIKAILKSDGTLFLCDDPTQSLFRYFSWKQKGIEVRGRSKLLRIPFRCTLEISIVAHALVEADPFLNTNSSDLTKPILDSSEIVSGDVPKLITFKDNSSEIQYIQKSIMDLLDEGVKGANIAVLCHKKYDAKHWKNLSRLGVYVNSFGKMKGLEFEYVFIPMIDTLIESSKNIEKDDYFVSQKRRELFTAMTRAKSVLILSHQNVLPEELKAIIPHCHRDVKY